LHAVDPLRPGASGLQKFLKGLGMISLLTGVALLIGVFSGSRDILQPLSKLNIASSSRVDSAGESKPNGDAGHLPFRKVKSVAELDQHILQSRDKYIMLEFSADWCISCKEMERFTFTDAKVQSRLKDVVLLQADVTAGTPEDSALLKRFKLFGPPGILFMDREGREIPGVRLIGYQNADNFLAVLNAVLI
jgi:thiol:disulfide interchange protein DsbD